MYTRQVIINNVRTNHNSTQIYFLLQLQMSYTCAIITGVFKLL